MRNTPARAPIQQTLIEARNLQVTFSTGRKKFVAVNPTASFSIYKGETRPGRRIQGLRSKTTIRQALLHISVTAGEVLYKGRRISGKISKHCEVVRLPDDFQDPMASLNEQAKVDYIVSEGLINHRLYIDEADRQRKVQEVLAEVGMLPEFASRFPHEFSGGQRQRISIAREARIIARIYRGGQAHQRAGREHSRAGILTCLTN